MTQNQFYRKNNGSRMLAACFILGLLGNILPSSAFLTPRAQNPFKSRDHGHQKNSNHRRNYVAKQRDLNRSTKTRLQSSMSLPSVSWLYLSLLALQFGCQPLLTKAFTPSKIIRSTVILAQDFMKLLLCCIVLLCNGNWASSMKNWTFRSALAGAGPIGALYLVQNYCALMAYQNLPPVTFNILNQTKTLSAALCCYLVMGRKQSPLQIISLVILLFSALVIEKLVPIGDWGRKQQRTSEDEQNSTDIEKAGDMNQLTMGVIPVLMASGISGLAGALSQRNLQTFGCNSYVFSMELSVFSIIFMLGSLLLGSPDGYRLKKGGIAEGWTWKTWIPILTHASGGVVVGLVTYHAGAVRKGFALIFGLILSGVLQNFFLSDDGVSSEQMIGGVLASLSLWMHSKFPPI